MKSHGLLVTFPDLQGCSGGAVCYANAAFPISASVQFHFFKASSSVSPGVKHLWVEGSFYRFVPLFRSQICFVGSYSCEVIFWTEAKSLQRTSSTHTDGLWDWKDYMPTSKQMWVWSRVHAAVVWLLCKARLRIDSGVENNRRRSFSAIVWVSLSPEIRLSCLFNDPSTKRKERRFREIIFNSRFDKKA